ncbi:2-hydroxychromene-2-carboxylate isomerase [Nitrincola iocasae]|uniref:2-hydroxychromene-2-carboxylate isomerase n=1 Tax=Nitrincola iocasae TaxID=2614693 RepID=A0A5J6LGV2_9GAMM|nr:2-hydroxychromene-2-carboxylate isomerase [Nitrincola iocasae]QEW07890.1 2-hydroxychromene-2-carboxylate isomerase [Nitrincola iocasae]
MTDLEKKSGAVEVPLEFWFDLSSNYSYLSLMRVEDLARGRGIDIQWRPFLLGPVFASLGWNNSPFVVQKAKGAYVKRDMERQCAKYSLPWSWPSEFPRRTLLPMRVAVYGQDQPWLADFCKRIMLLNFAEDQEIDSPEVVGDVLCSMGLPASDIIDASQNEAFKQALRIQTQQAQEKGIFGAPMFVVHRELFWGNDRLEDAINYCAEVKSQ